MAKATSSAPSQRMLRVGEQVRAALTQILQRGEVRDDLLEKTVISISEVRMSPDLKIATAYVTPLGVADHTESIDALNRHAKFIRGRLGPQLRQMKYVPEVRFRDDTSFDNYQKIDALLRSPEVQRDLGSSNEKDDEQN
ncbi:MULTISPECIES: 30S ribosome-binding factor RbfA [Rhizobium/Agrobacterium group]|jgi:ribosome-binding factor A|uniref:Ribosome-binding factor A n=1 Tax=Rhizobium rhizogenes TaxID=359 RepID=A0AA92C2M6_RHIRH|nr:MULTISPECIES: 30S ribosome-binding factor RbfA [Rhizobium/Agrobacterium group]KQM30311.1 ribosome-binding factor A [Rhizobium sp. Leaf202]KQN83164.1 ribosome-binding factor A [Rhizobium sp. Leaf68]KQR31928.1 ribosome-binding factor A [Rhizobium sp. Leaf155]KQZ93655.1 ribosome-binding factor A [Rhizobium sp. Root564]MDP9569669.1 ribosome-binding factor A [Agrobacterium larrymoorei]MQB21973.1 30S ribosome-binding factor RbfA [Agrobacterium tumefaciens]PVE76333.1 30S ribosome-binding factor 